MIATNEREKERKREREREREREGENAREYYDDQNIDSSKKEISAHWTFSQQSKSGNS